MTSPALAMSVAGAGALGMLSGTVGHQALSMQLDEIPVGAVVGVNFLVPFLDPEAVGHAARRSRLVEFFWGTPDADLIGAVHDGGARAGWQVGSAEEARQAAAVGCDVVIAQGIEAGGHVRGTVGLLSLLDEVCGVVEIPVIAAGGIGSGRAVAAALMAGADAVRIGTRFMAAIESTAHPAYVDALIRATADDTEITTAFGAGWPDAPHRVLRSSIEAGERLGSVQSWSPEWPSATYMGDPMARPLYAGQSVGSVRSRQRAADIIEELVGDAERLLSR